MNQLTSHFEKTIKENHAVVAFFNFEIHDDESCTIEKVVIGW